MVSSYKVVNSSPGRGALATASCLAKLAHSHATLALSPRCQSRSARAVRPASLAASARKPFCHQLAFPARHPTHTGLGLSREQDRGHWFAGFGESEGLVSEPRTQLSVSKQMKPQCIVMHLHSCFTSLPHS